MSKRPPKLFLHFFRWFCHPSLKKTIEGDLIELYGEAIEKLGKRRADLQFIRDVVLLFRPKIIKPADGTYKINNYGMFKNYLKTSIRSIQKNALFSAINVIGLAISMSVGILMISLITELNSFDSFHEKKDRIYRVTSNKFMFGRELDMGAASHYVGVEIEKQVPGVENVLIMRDGMSADFRTDNGILNVSGFYATDAFFDVFSFKLLQGNPETAFSDPNNIVLTKSTADRLFGETSPMGQALDLESTGGWQTRTIKGNVVGIMEDPPVNSHIHFQALVSMKTYDQPATGGTGWQRDYKTHPRHFQRSQVYVVLEEQTRKKDVESALVDIVADYNAEQEEAVTHLLQPMSSFVTNDQYQNRTGARFSKRQMYMMLGLTLVVLLSACFNYTNLSLARALRRSKEVGVRKVTGASRSQVFAQFMVEAVLLSLLALVVGLGLFYLIKPGFLNMPNPASSGHEMFTLDIGGWQLIYFILFAIIIGVLAGFIPAKFLSNLKTSSVFNDASKVKLFSGLNLRKLLTIFQFVLSIGLIMTAVLVNKQYQFALNYDVGFDTENIVNVRIKGNYIDRLENEYAKIPQVIGTSQSMMSMGTGGAELATIESEDKAHRSRFFWNGIDEKYLQMHDFELLAGTGFLNPLQENQPIKQIIVNEHCLESLNLGTPQEAIGKFVQVYGYVRRQVQIVGVVKNFINTSINTGSGDEIMAVKNFAFMQGMPAFNNGQIGVKFSGNDLFSVMQALEASYEMIDPDHPFEANFYDDQIAKTYESQKTSFKVISFLAFLAISISMLGLLGMAVFTTESRMKEISIRKVLGAELSSIMLLLSKGFLAMIVVAGLIAIPLAKYIVDQKILNEFNYKVETGLADFLSGFLIVLVIGIVTIIGQIRRAALQNPANLLRKE